MTHLRKMMLEELERRNYAQTTIDCYIQTVEDFARYFRRRPDQLTPEHIREYQAYLFRERKLAASTVTQRLAALRFFYTRTLKKTWSVADTPYPKKARHLPSILSPEEVAHLIDSSQTWFHRIVLMTLYGTGVRRAELTRLQIPDINSRRMVIHIRGGKGRQGPQCHAQSHVAERLTRLLAWAEAQTHGMVIPRRIPAHLQSSHHSPSRVVCLPTCCPAGGPAAPGSSPHPAPLFCYSLTGKRC
jgi:integrase/recombinase XerD